MGLYAKIQRITYCFHQVFNCTNGEPTGITNLSYCFHQVSPCFADLKNPMRSQRSMFFRNYQRLVKLSDINYLGWFIGWCKQQNETDTEAA